MTDEQKKILEEAIVTFGANQQVAKAMEELSELIRALARQDGQNIIEEVADVRIMLEQLEMIFDIRWEVRQEMDEKIRRLEARLHGDDLQDRVLAGLAACQHDPLDPKHCAEMECPYLHEDDCIPKMAADALKYIETLEGQGHE